MNIDEFIIKLAREAAARRAGEEAVRKMFGDDTCDS